MTVLILLLALTATVFAISGWAGLGRCRRCYTLCAPWSTTCSAHREHGP
ncbi:hypothetical protein [Actinoplanes sp. NBRC 101535]|nr:hypothetical protein [Actinoplanes sp. NBRC 101535]